jgi:signal transduction histidine kinase
MRRMAVASSLLALVVAVAFAVLILAIVDLRNTAQASRHSQEVIAAATRLERLVVDLETGQRGFLITREERFLEPWTAARSALPDASRNLNLLAAVPAQDSRARQITQATASYIRDYSVPLVAAARRNDGSVRSVAATDEGKRLLDGIRNQFDRFLAAERDLGATRQERSDSATRNAVIGAVGGLAGSIFLIALYAGFLTRAIVRPVRRAAVMAGRLAGGDFATRMPETGTGEIRALERSFNTMGSSLEKSRAQLAASRARIVATADETRRRIERDLHDGIQQRLVSLALTLRVAQATVPSELGELKARFSQVADGLGGVLDELQEVSRGIHPAILTEGGLGPALKTLARRSAVPVELEVHSERRLPAHVEVAAYYVVSEALTNAAKHAHASVAHVDVEASNGVLQVSIRDDGGGGADPAQGSGLVGLTDRVEALGGTIEVVSPVGEGTSLLVTLPVEDG